MTGMAETAPQPLLRPLKDSRKPTLTMPLTKPLPPQPAHPPARLILGRSLPQRMLQVVRMPTAAHIRARCSIGPKTVLGGPRTRIRLELRGRGRLRNFPRVLHRLEPFLRAEFRARGVHGRGAGVFEGEVFFSLRGSRQ